MTFEQWKLHDFDPGGGLAEGAHDAGYDDGEWAPVAIPSDVHRAILDAG